MAPIPKLPRETSSRRLWVDGFSSSTFHPWQLTLFEIPNKSFVLYAFISKNWHKFCFVFSFALVSQYCSYVFFVFFFNIPYFSIAQYLENVLYNALPRWKKNPAIHTPKTYMNWVRVKNSNFEIFENVSFKNHYKSKGENSW